MPACTRADLLCGYRVTAHGEPRSLSWTLESVLWVPQCIMQRRQELWTNDCIGDVRRGCNTGEHAKAEVQEGLTLGVLPHGILQQEQEVFTGHRIDDCRVGSDASQMSANADL